MMDKSNMAAAQPWSWVFTGPDMGRIIRASRKAKGWTQQDLADQIGVNRTVVTRMEAGRSVAFRTVLDALAFTGRALVVAPKDAQVAVNAETAQMTLSVVPPTIEVSDE